MEKIKEKKRANQKDNYYDIVFRTYYKEALFSAFLLIVSVASIYLFIYLTTLNKIIAFSISVFFFFFLLVFCSKGLEVLLDLDKKHIESRRIIIKSTARETRWYDWLFAPRYVDKSFTENFFPEGLIVRRYKLYYESKEGSDLIRLLMAREREKDLSLYLYDLDYLRKNEKVKRSRKRADHELIFDVKYYKHSKIVCEIKPIKGSEYEKEDEELLKNILRLN